MYCQHCGKGISDQALFCRYCGKATSSNITTVSTVVATPQNDEYNREVLKLYLGQLRNLECAKNKLQKNIYKTDDRIASLGHSQIGYPPRKQDFAGLGSVFGGFGFGIGILLVGSLLNGIGEWLFNSSIIMTLAVILAIIVIVCGIIIGVGEASDQSKEERRYEEEKENDEMRVEIELIEKNKLSLARKNMDIEFNQVNALLTKAYSVNIIPAQFRNLHAVYYLHDFLSTSNETLTSGLMHCDLDVIKQKLDEIIEQQQTIILNQAIIMSQNEQIMQQNDRQLRHIINAEINSEKAATYAQIASINSEACAWIGVANYIKDK